MVDSRAETSKKRADESLEEQDIVIKSIVAIPSGSSSTKHKNNLVSHAPPNSSHISKIQTA